MPVLEKNIEALLNIDSDLIDHLKGLENVGHLEVSINENSAHVNLFDKKNDFLPLVEGKPEAFVQEKLKMYKTKALYPYLYFFGLGDGVFYKQLLRNTFHKRVVVIEPCLETIFIILSLVDLSTELQSGRLMLGLSADFDFSTANHIFRTDKDVKLYAKVYDLDVFSAYYDRIYEAEILRVNEAILRAFGHIIVSCGNDSIDNLVGLRHFVDNLELMSQSSEVTNFIKNVKNSDTAILVSTGPSLAKQLPLLKRVQDKVSIFCVDASLPILQKWGIVPDVVASIERVKQTADFYADLDFSALKNTTFCISAIAHKDLIKTIKNVPNLCLPMRPFGYMQYLKLDEYGYVGEGMSSANMLFEIIVRAQFKKCVIIGQDLAYTPDGKSHSLGAIRGEEEIKPSNTDIYLPAYGAKGKVRSRSIWKLFLNFFEKDIAIVKGVIAIINATEGGAKIEGAIEQTFEKALKKELQSTRIKTPIVLQKTPTKMANDAFKKAQQVLKAMAAYGQKKEKEIETLFLKIKKTDFKTCEDKHLDELTMQLEYVKQFFNEEDFRTIFLDIVQSYITHYELELAKIQVEITTTKEALREKKIKWLQAHESWLFYLAGVINNMTSVFQGANQE